MVLLVKPPYRKNRVLLTHLLRIIKSQLDLRILVMMTTSMNSVVKQLALNKTNSYYKLKRVLIQIDFQITKTTTRSLCQKM